jgi:hypothetical protein
VKQNVAGSSRGRIVALSAISGFMAPLVFVSVLALRKVNRRGKIQFRRLNKRFQHELARWT